MKLVSEYTVAIVRRVSLMAIAAIVTAAFAPTTLAQNAPQFEELPAFKHGGTKDIADWNAMSSFMRDEKKVIDAMLAGGSFDQAKFDQFFNDVVFPMFTQRKSFAHPTVSPARIRKRFKSEFIANAKNPPARDRLYTLTLEAMDKIAKGNFYPVARGNAMLMIAELNDGEPGPPLKKAFPYLLKAATDKSAADVIRAPAIRGVLRHAAAGPDGIEAAQRPAVVGAMLDIVKQHTAAAEQSLEIHEWVLRRAIDVLATIGEPGDKGVVFTELVNLVEDEAAPRPARATAAAALAKIRFTPPKEFDAEGLAKSLGKLAVESYKAELADATSKRRPIAIERIKQQLGEVRTGVVGADGKGGVAAMMPAEPQKKFAADMATQIDSLLKACDTPRAEPPDPMFAQQQPGYVPGVPFDTQEPIAKAVNQAGGGLEAVLQAGVGGAVKPADLPGEVPPPGPPTRPATARAPMDLPGLPPM